MISLSTSGGNRASNGPPPPPGVVALHDVSSLDVPLNIDTLLLLLLLLDLSHRTEQFDWLRI